MKLNARIHSGPPLATTGARSKLRLHGVFPAFFSRAVLPQEVVEPKSGNLLALACLLAAITAPAPAAEPLGRLFFTPSQRASLDVARSQRTRTTVATEKTNEEAVPVPEVITYGGMVRRNDGKTTVWINNRAVHDKAAGGGTSIVNRVQPDGGISLQVPQSGRSVDLKVGQSVELLSGSIEESYARRAAAPKPEPKPAAKAAKGTPPAERKTEEAQDRAQREREETERPAAQEPKPAAAGPAGGR